MSAKQSINSGFCVAKVSFAFDTIDCSIFPISHLKLLLDRPDQISTRLRSSLRTELQERDDQQLSHVTLSTRSPRDDERATDT